MACEETVEGKNHNVDLAVSRECFVQFITLFYRQREWGMLLKLTFLIGGNSHGSHHFGNSSIQPDLLAKLSICTHIKKS
jgi:hypothetical protein